MPGGGRYLCNVLDPMAQKIPKQEQISPQMDLEPEMGAAGAAVRDTSPPPLYQNPPPIPAETVCPGTPDMAQLVAILAGMENQMNANMESKMEENLKNNTNEMEANTSRMENKMEANTKGMREEMKEMRGEMQKMGHGLQAGIMALVCSETRTTVCKMAVPRGDTMEPARGSVDCVGPAGEDRVIRETWRVTEKVTETVTQTLKGEETTCTRETRRQVTELTGTRETVEERLHGVEEEEDAHTHTHTQVARDDGGELAERVGTRCEQLVSLPREQGEGVCPLEAGHGQVDSVVPREVEGVSAADGCTRSLGGMKTPGALVEARIPRVGVSVPVCVVKSVAPVSVVPVCVVSRCVYTSVWKCVLRRTHTGSKRACVRVTPSASPCVDEPPSTSETPCTSGVVTGVPECVLPGTPCVKGAPQAEETTCAREAARVCEPPVWMRHRG